MILKRLGAKFRDITNEDPMCLVEPHAGDDEREEIVLSWLLEVLKWYHSNEKKNTQLILEGGISISYLNLYGHSIRKTVVIVF